MNKWRSLRGNILSLSLLQIFNYAYPFLFYPFITKSLGPEKFGLISFFTAYIAYFIILIDYGFNLTATQSVALNRNDKEQLQQIYNNVTSTKILLLLLGLILLVLSLVIIPEFKTEKLLCIIIFSGVMSNVMVPLWYFQGIEKMKIITILNILPKLLIIPVVIIMIKSPEDYILFATVSSSAMVFSGLVSIMLLRFKYALKFSFSSYENIKTELKSGFDIFLAGALTSLYTVTAIFALGLYSNNEVVGFYSLAEKIVKTLGTIFVPVINAAYPFLVKLSESNNNESTRLNNKILMISIAIMGTASIIVFVLSEQIIDLFAGDSFKTAAQLLKILSPFPLIITVARHLSVNYIMVHGMKRELLKIYSVTAAVSVVLFLILIPQYGAVGTAYSVITIELVATLLMFLLCYKKGLFYE